MSAINPDLFLRDELEFELRSRDKWTLGDVASMRKQLGEALAAGEVPSPVKVSDESKEMELCLEKWGELRELAECLESAPCSSRAAQRIRQRLEHLRQRIQNMST